MPRKAIGVLYLLSISFELFGLVAFMRVLGYKGLTNENVVLSGIFLIAAAVMGVIAWIGMLMNLARAQAWPMFILAFFFSGIILLIYLLSNAQTFAAKTPGQIPYSPAQGSVSAPREVVFKYGVITGGTLQIIILVCAALGQIFALGQVRGLFFANALYLGVPLLLSLPVFFWGSWAVARRVRQAQAGLAIALRACAWLMLTCGLLFLSDMLDFVQHNPPFLLYNQSIYLMILGTDIVQALLFFGVAFGLGTVAGHAGARQGVAAPIVPR